MQRKKFSMLFLFNFFYSQKQPPEVFYNKTCPKNFAKFRGKHLSQSLFFNKVAGLRPATLLKKRLWHRCFLVNFAKFLRTPFLQNTSGCLLVHSKFQVFFLCFTLKIDCIKIEAMSLVLNLSILAEILCVLFTLTSSFASDWKKSSSWLNFFLRHANEIKACGLVQQLILGMLRDLILQSRDFQSLKGMLRRHNEHFLKIWIYEKLRISEIVEKKIFFSITNGL